MRQTMKTPTAAIGQLTDAQLRDLLERYVYPVSNLDQRRRALEFTVEEGWADGFIPASAIMDLVS